MGGRSLPGMAKHTLDLNLPRTALANVDAELVVKADGKRLGTAHISKGGIDWIPAQKSVSGHTVTWETFAELMKQHGTPKKKK
jgi:hypothetical protein